MDVEGLLELAEHVVRCRVLHCVGRLFARAGPEAVDAQAARQLCDPWAEGLVVAQRIEALVDPGEHLLEDVLGVVLWEAEGLHADRVDVAREAVYELAPRVVVARAAARNELGVGKLARQCWAERSRFAIVSSSFHAIEAFDSTSGRNSQEVSP